MHIAIIGCGASGLASIQRAMDHDVECTAFEMSDSIGGMWRYREETDLGDLGNPMYYTLRTNLPVQLMEFGDFQFKPKNGSSFPHNTEVVEYLEAFAKRYNLYSRIKFHHKVIKLSRSSDLWLIKVKNLLSNEDEDFEFDGVMICSGHFSKPLWPNILGSESFPGIQIHSLCYRRNNLFKDKKVLIVGAGPSGMDIGLDIAEVAEKVIISYSRFSTKAKPAKNVEMKPRTCSIDADIVHFVDESSEAVDAIIYCTGYKYYYPYLDPSCGIDIEDDLVIKPLFKHLFNIHHPTMCFIGLIRMISTILFYLQAEVYMQCITKKVQLPSTEEMFKSWEAECAMKASRNLPKSYFFFLGRNLQQYFDDLTELGKMKPTPPALLNILRKIVSIVGEDFSKLRKYSFEIINDTTFICHEK